MGASEAPSSIAAPIGTASGSTSAGSAPSAPGHGPRQGVLAESYSLGLVVIISYRLLYLHLRNSAYKHLPAC